MHDSTTTSSQKTITLDSALDSAAANGNLEICKSLLTNPKLTNACKAHALNTVAANGNLEICRLFLEKGNIKENGIGRALKAAVENRHTETFGLLLAETKSDIAKLWTGWILEAAATNGHTEAIKLFLASPKVVNISGNGICRALRAAVKSDNVEIVNLLNANTKVQKSLSDAGYTLKFTIKEIVSDFLKTKASPSSLTQNASIQEVTSAQGSAR